MFVVHGTKKFLDRVSRPNADPEDRSTTALGNWYATPLFWKPQVALFTSDRTLVPVLVPLAPAVTVVDRFPAHLAEVLAAHGAEPSFIRAELREMTDHRLSKTKSRSVLGVMNEWRDLGTAYYADGDDDLVSLSVRLAETPTSPLYDSEVTPAGELAAVVASSSV